MDVVSVFDSLEGEVTLGGALQWTVFVRLGGCNLRCYRNSGYCDTPQSLEIKGNYPVMTADELLQRALALGPRRLTFTGGEPLLSHHQHDVFYLAHKWRELGGTVSVETNGSIYLPTRNIRRFDCVVMDLKTPSTEMHAMMKLDNLERLRKRDFVKLVVEDPGDLRWAADILNTWPTDATISIGPRMTADNKYYLLTPDHIVEWMRANKLWSWRLNLQLQKVIWPNKKTPTFEDCQALQPTDYEGLQGEEV